VLLICEKNMGNKRQLKRSKCLIQIPMPNLIHFQLVLLKSR
jgi:hypothetical protein